MENVTFKIATLITSDCANQIQHAIQAAEALAQVQISLVAQTATVQFDGDRLSVPRLQSILRAIGHPATITAPIIAPMPAAASGCCGGCGGRSASDSAIAS